MTQCSTSPRGRVVECKPINTLSSYGPLEFIVPKVADHYLVLSETMLLLEAKITRDVGEDEDDKCGPLSLRLHSLFKRVDVYLNDAAASADCNADAFKDYLLSPQLRAKGSRLFCGETAGEMTVENDEDDAEQRREFNAVSRVVRISGRLRADVCGDNLKLGGVDLRLKLHRSEDEFCRLSHSADTQHREYRVQILDATLCVQQVKLNPALISRENITARVPFCKSEIKSFSIPQNSLSWIVEPLYSGRVPSRIVIGLVEAEAYGGVYNLDAFFPFRRFNVNRVTLSYGGVPVPPKPFAQTISGKDCAEENYRHVDFNLTADDSNDDESVCLQLCFGQPLAETVKLLVYAEFDSLMEVTQSQIIALD